MNDPNENQVSNSEPAPQDQGASENVNNTQKEVLNSQTVQGTESTESGEQQTSPSDESTSESSQPETKVDENFEWDGNNVDDLPKPLQKRAKDMLRHMHKVSQEAAAVKKYAEGYQQIVNHPEFKEFLDWKEGRASGTQPQAEPISQLTEEELIAAQGDPQKFHGLMQQAINQAVQPYVKQFQQQLQQVSQKQAIEEGNRQLNAFAEQHPDFWDIDPVVMKAAIQDIVVKQGKSLDDAYSYAKNIEKQYLTKAQSSLQQEVAKKKKAVSNKPTQSSSPSVIYVKDREEARRVAFENATLGKKVDVRIKR